MWTNWLVWGLISVGVACLFIVFMGYRMPPEWGRQEELRPDPVDTKTVEERMRENQC